MTDPPPAPTDGPPRGEIVCDVCDGWSNAGDHIHCMHIR